VATGVGDAALKAEDGVSERVTDVDGAVDADGATPKHPASNRPRTESGQRIRMQSACRENRIHDRPLSWRRYDRVHTTVRWNPGNMLGSGTDRRGDMLPSFAYIQISARTGVP
jgi:hypothetical protein